MNEEIINCQNELAMSLVNSVKDKWLQIVCSYEMQEDSECYNDDVMLFYLKKSFLGKVSKIDFYMSEETRQCFKKLRKIVGKLKGDLWNSCEVIVDHTGDFEVNFSYEPPKRINGILNESSYEKYNNYTYKNLS